jgi:hypothetical protein
MVNENRVARRWPAAFRAITRRVARAIMHPAAGPRAAA